MFNSREIDKAGVEREGREVEGDSAWTRCLNLKKRGDGLEEEIPALQRKVRQRAGITSEPVDSENEVESMVDGDENSQVSLFFVFYPYAFCSNFIFWHLSSKEKRAQTTRCACPRL